MTVCNSCRYCEGVCAVFPAMEMRRAFEDSDLNYLANLCHSCGACFIDCQFSPPHEFNVNVPKVLSVVRAESYAAYAWPVPLPGVFARNGLVVSIVAALSVALFVLGFVGASNPAALYASGAEAGAFYRLMPHNAMALLFGAAFVFAILALVMSGRNFWHSTRAADAPPIDLPGIWQAMKDAGSLRYLDGAGAGCYVSEDAPKDMRRFHHHLTFYGFLLCFAATSVATLYHYILHREAPYPVWDLPVLLGFFGGLGLVVGPIGLLRAKASRDEALVNAESEGMDRAFLGMMFATGLTGLALLLLRDTLVMGLTLAVHLGVVFALFLTMPYGKFVHGIYRYLALVRYAGEKRQLEAGGGTE
jgi:citrate/tricarballylate utilization protein